MRARHLQALGALIVVGAALRFATLDAQSFWQDEAATVDLLRMGFGDMLDGIPDSESTPPLYYVLAWLWTQVAGTGEVGVRSLSALAGTAAIPVAYALASWAAGRRAALIAAAVVATNPFLVWYSQEARAYALLILLTALALLFMVRRRTVAWGLASAAAIATHWFALFPVAAMALYLLARLPRRQALPVVAGVGVVGLALLPLALGQRENDTAHFIDDSSLLRRLAQVPKQFTTGYDAPAEALVTAAALLLVAIGAAGLLRADAEVRRRIAPVAAVGAAALAIPAVLALAGPDYLIARNLLPALVPLAVVAAAGFALQRFGKEAAVVLAVLGAGLTIATATEPAYQRDDWRGAAEALGPPRRDRVVYVTPAAGLLPLSLYLAGSKAVGAEGAQVTEIDLVALPQRRPGDDPRPPRPTIITPPAAGFDQVGRTEADTFTSVIFHSQTPFGVTPTVGASPLDGRPARGLSQPAGGG